MMPTEHGNAFRFEERTVGHLASLARSLARPLLSAVCLSGRLSVDRLSPKKKEE